MKYISTRQLQKKRGMVFPSNAPNSCQIFHQCIFHSSFRHVLRSCWYRMSPGQEPGREQGRPQPHPQHQWRLGCFSKLSACLRELPPHLGIRMLLREGWWLMGAREQGEAPLVRSPAPGSPWWSSHTQSKLSFSTTKVGAQL